MEPVKGGQRATLQHVGRVVLPTQAAQRLMEELKRVLQQ
jgi:hypothetical protein